MTVGFVELRGDADPSVDDVSGNAEERMQGMTRMELASAIDIPAEELTHILRQGALLRLPFLQGRHRLAVEEVRRLESKYSTTLKELQEKGLPLDAGYEMHEDFIEWEYWEDARAALDFTIDKVRYLLQETESSVRVS
jgi:hypothetical protein